MQQDLQEWATLIKYLHNCLKHKIHFVEAKLLNSKYNECKKGQKIFLKANQHYAKSILCLVVLYKLHFKNI